MSHAALYTIVALWSVTGVFVLLKCLACLLCCCPKRVHSCLAVLLFLLVVVSTLTTAFYTHKLHELANGGMLAAHESWRLAELLVDK